VREFDTLVGTGTGAAAMAEGEVAVDPPRSAQRATRTPAASTAQRK
jgi:hypothetical protein